MTKPDTIPPGASKSRDLWLKVIEGQRHVTKLGYYCTRQPDDDERARNITSAQARIAEKEFFAKTAPWSTSSSKDRFGTDNLIASMSKLLAMIIDDSYVSMLNSFRSEVYLTVSPSAFRTSRAKSLVSSRTVPRISATFPWPSLLTQPRTCLRWLQTSATMSPGI